MAHCIKNLISNKFTQSKYGANRCKTTVKSRTKMVNTAFALESTTSCKLVCNCGIYHLCLWFPPRFLSLLLEVFAHEKDVKDKDFFYHLHKRTGRFKVWLFISGKENSGLVNFVPELRLPFVQIRSIYLKRFWKPETGIKDALKETEHEVITFRPSKQD